LEAPRAAFCAADSRRGCGTESKGHPLTTKPIRARTPLFLLAALVFGTAAAAQLQDPQAPAAQTPPEPQAIFEVHEYRVLGNTVLSNREIDSVLHTLIGDKKTRADIEAARAALEKAIHDHGYNTVFVELPEQDIADHVIRFQIREVRLHDVRVTGARHFSQRQILAHLPAATAGSVPNLTALQAQISDLNAQTADLNVVPSLKVGQEPDTVDLTLNVNDHLPFHGSLEFNNQNTPQTKPLRMIASLSYGNLFQDFDNVSMQYQSSPQEFKEVKVFAASYASGALWAGIRPSVYFVDSDSNLAAVSSSGLLGKGYILGSQLAVPLTDAPGMPQSLTVGAEYKHFLQSVVSAGAASPVAPDATLDSYLNLSLGYRGTWASDRLRGTLATTLNYGPRGAPNAEATSSTGTTDGARYLYLKTDGSVVIPIREQFQLDLRATGQYTSKPLILYEEMSMTGVNAVRGYLEAESLADKGVLGSVQLQSPTWRQSKASIGDLFLFYDEGYGRLFDPSPGVAGALTLRSWGVGVHLLPGKSITGSLTWADPLASGPNTKRGDSRLLFDVRGAF
jgi:hemolysin activation/secretion protein